MYKKTVVFDFDGVIHDYHGWKGETVIDGEPVRDIEYLLSLLGNYRLVIVSSRAISPEGKQAIKVPAIIYVDDRAVRFTGDISNDIDNINKHI